MSPDKAYLMEKPHLKALPPYIPPVSKPYYRHVDTEGYIILDTNRYSVPERFVVLKQQLEVLCYWERIEVYHKRVKIAEHPRIIGKKQCRITDPCHHKTPWKRGPRQSPSPEEKALCGRSEALDQYVATLKKRPGRCGGQLLRRLLDIQRTYPKDAFLRAVEEALHYGLYDLARVPYDWTLQTFPFDRQPGVNKSRILSLASLSFVERADNIVFIGNTGTGKTGLAIGLLREAIVNGYRGCFYDAQNFLDELYASLADRATPKLIKRLCRYDILVIDEMGYLTLKPEQVNAFFKLIEGRYGRRATIITTNLDYQDWYELFQRKPLVDAMLDRLKHQCITIKISDPSLRTPYPEEKSPHPKP